MRTISASISKRLLPELPRFFQGYPGMVKELYQNAHRAGATILNITLDPTYTVLVFSDNGHGCDNLADLICAGETGWDEAEIVEPAGVGFFSVLNPNLVSSVTVDSKGYRMVLHPEHVLASKPINIFGFGIENAPGTRIEIRFKLPVYTPEAWHRNSEPWLDEIREARGVYPMQVLVNGAEYESKEWNPQYEVKTPVGLVGLRACKSGNAAYWEYRCIGGKTFAAALHEAAAKSNDPLACPVVAHYNIHWIVNPACGVRPQLPGRDELIPGRELDKAAEIILDYALKILREDYAKCVTYVPVYGTTERHCGNVFGFLKSDSPKIPVDMGLAILRAFGWQTHEFIDPATFTYSLGHDDSYTDMSYIAMYCKGAYPTPEDSTALTINLQRADHLINISANVAESGEHAVVKGLKQNKKAMIAIAKEITFRGVKLPYLFLDEDSRTHYVGDDSDVWVIVAGNCAQVIETLKKHQCIAGWTAMRINDEDSLGNYDDWLVPGDSGDDDLNLGAVEDSLIAEVLNNYGDRRVAEAANRYYSLDKSATEVRSARHKLSWLDGHERSGDKTIDALVAAQLKSMTRLLTKVEDAQQKWGIKAKLVEKPAPKKRSRK